MSLLRPHLDGRGIGVSQAADQTDLFFPGWLIAFSLHHTNLSAAGSGLDAGFLWSFVLYRPGDCSAARSPCQKTSGNRSPQANLCRLYSVAMDSGVRHIP